MLSAMSRTPQNQSDPSGMNLMGRPAPYSPLSFRIKPPSRDSPSPAHRSWLARNAHFGKLGQIVAHENVRKRLQGKSGTAPEALPVVTFDHGLSIHFNGEEIRVLALAPGHTDGDAVIHSTKSGVVHMGDQFFNGRFPFIDLGSGGSVEGYLRNVAVVLQKISSDVKIIPGHGPLASKADLRIFHDTVSESIEIIRKAKDAGQSLDQVKAAGLPEKFKIWGSGFINTSRWIEMVYNSLKKN